MKTHDETQEYQRKYWRENRERLLAKRRRRYQEDEEFRDSILERSRARGKAERKARLKSKRKTEPRGLNKSRIVELHGERLEVWGVGHLLKEAGVSVQSLTAWESGGKVPGPTLKDQRGWRWYSREDLERVSQVIQSMKRRGRGANAPRSIVHRGQTIDVFSMGTLLKVLMVSRSTLIKWERDGVVPAPTLTDELGRRWYSKRHIDFLAEMMIQRKNGSGRLDAFKKLVRAEWKKCKRASKKRARKNDERCNRNQTSEATQGQDQG